MKAMAVASGGGHWVQLLRLRPAFAEAEVTYVTVDRGYRAHVPGNRFYAVNDATRWNFFGLIALTVRLAAIMLRERPDVVVTTGAAPGYLAIRLAHFVGARTVWIDSMANVDRLSLSGERAGRFADLWLTQWPALAAEGGPCYGGSVL